MRRQLPASVATDRDEREASLRQRLFGKREERAVDIDRALLSSFGSVRQRYRLGSPDLRERQCPSLPF